MRTEQEKAWAGGFGDAYNRRAPGNVEANKHLFQWALGWCNIASMLEIGAGTGANLAALSRYFADRGLKVDYTAVEINQNAAVQIQQAVPEAKVVTESILEWSGYQHEQWDLVLTKGLLIHIPPEHLPMVYEKIHAAARRWVLLVEYYNPRPQAVTYRGEEGLLWKRDFAGEMLDRYPDLRLVDYGFVYHRDEFPQDDVTWFMMKKVEQRAA